MTTAADRGFQAEQRALGALLMADDPRRLVADNAITADLFSDAGHRAIFAALLTAAAPSSAEPPPSVEDVIVALDAESQLAMVGGPSYVHELSQCVVTDRNLHLDVRRIRQAAVRRAAASEAELAAVRLREGADLVEVVDGLMQTLQTTRSESSGSTPVPFDRTPVADLLEAAPPAPSYWWQGLVPAGAVTLWTGHGGSAKSFILLMLGAALATDSSLFGVDTRRRGRVAFYSAEDSANVTRHRLHLICTKLGIDPAELAERLHVLDATIADPVLFREVQAKDGRHGQTTPAYDALRNYLAAERIQVLIVDNASDVYDGSEIDRARVRAFMRALVRLVPDEGAVILAGHVDKGTSRGDRGGIESYSGSTAWHNSARSRIAQTRDKDGAIELVHQKSNHGPLHAPIRLVWPPGGVPQLDEPLSGVVQHIADRNHTGALLRLIHEFTERGEFVSTATTSRTHAGKLLRGQPGFPHRLPDADLFDLLRQAERRGLLARTRVRSKGRGHDKEVWQITPKGCESAGLAPTAPTAPTYGVGAVARSGAEAAPTAPTSAPGGVGGMGARTPMATGATR